LDQIAVLSRALQSVHTDYWKESHVIVEKQVGCFSFAQLEAAVYMYALAVKPLSIQTIHPKEKLKVSLGGVQDKEFAKKYDANKNYAVAQFQALLARHLDTPP
jgi:hypothetical protein